MEPPVLHVLAELMYMAGGYSVSGSNSILPAESETMSFYASSDHTLAFFQSSMKALDTALSEHSAICLLGHEEWMP